MKPNFALTFTSDSIGLLHRTARGWLEIGTTPFDAPDLPEALSYLRRSALGLAPHGVTSKLVLPEDQILYLELEAPGPSDSVREGQIRRALEGRTPYDVADLVFDWSGEGRKVQVAVIARETLAEAEAFAAEHRFNPVSFAAHPDPARFGGEPWFGATALAASLLPPGEMVERDQEALRVMSRQARAEAAAAALAATAAAAAPAAKPALPEPTLPEPVSPAPPAYEPPAMSDPAPAPTEVLAEVAAPALAAAEEVGPEALSETASPDMPQSEAVLPEAARPEPLLSEAASPDAWPPEAALPDMGLAAERAFDALPDDPLPELQPGFAPEGLTAEAFAPDALASEAFAPEALAPEALAPEQAAPMQSAAEPLFEIPPDAFAPDAFAEVLAETPAPLQAAFDLTPPATSQPASSFGADRAVSTGPEVIPPVTTPPRRTKPWTPPAEPGLELDTTLDPELDPELDAASPALSQPAASQPVAEALPADLLARALAADIPPMPEAPFIAVEDGYDLEDLHPELPAAPIAAGTGAGAAAGAGPKLAVTSVTPHRRAPAAPLVPPATAASAAEARPYSAAAEEAPLASAPADDPQGDLPPPLAAPVLAARATGAGALGAAPTRPGKAVPPAAAAPAAAVTRAKASAKPVKGALAGLVTAPGIAGLGAMKGKAKPAKPAATSTLVAPPPAETQATAATALRGRPEIRRGKPRYLGLVLTGLLLLALAIIGAWSSITLSRMNTPAVTPQEAPVEQAALPSEVVPEALPATVSEAETVPEPDAAVLAADQPSPDDEAAADGEVLAATEAAAAVLAAALPVETAPNTETATNAGTDTGTDTGPLPVRLAGEQDEIILSSNDAPPQASDALTLPPAQASVDALPAPAVPPPPFGTQYEFGADGLILPTPEGIVTPDGLRLVAGAPPKKPPPRPAAIAALAASTSNAPVAGQPAAEQPAAAPAADPRLQGFRPRPRPEGLRIPGADDAALDIPADRRMTSLRPRARPAALAEEAAARAAQLSRQAAQDEAARAAAAAASLSATAAAQPGSATVPQGEDPAAADPNAADPTAEAIAAAVAPRAGPISPQAVTISRKPPKKPRDFNRRVQAAVAAAAAPALRAKPAPEAEPEEPQRSARSAEPGEDEEPTAPAAKAPKVPTKASVAKNATFANAINLGKTNLIGVYGTPSKRYALIRLGSGQYKKVRVGDRVDGGTVAAITESEVRYKKGGRMVALAMPRG